MSTTKDVAVGVIISGLTTKLDIIALLVPVDESNQVMVFNQKDLGLALGANFSFDSTSKLQELCQDNTAVAARIRQCQIQEPPQCRGKYVPCTVCHGHGAIELVHGVICQVRDLTEALTLVFHLHIREVLTTDESVALLQQALEQGLCLERPTVEEILSMAFAPRTRPN